MAPGAWLLAAVLVAAAAVAGAAEEELVRIQEAVDAAGWRRAGRAPRDAELELVVALRNWNMDKLNDEVEAVSSPRSPRYGQHLRPAEVADLTSAAPEAALAVRGWLRAAGLEPRPSRWGDRVAVRATVAKVERLFGTSVEMLEKAGSPPVYQASDLFAPAPVAEAVAAVFGLHGTPLQRLPGPAAGRLPARTTPQLLRQVHEVSGVQVDYNGRNSRAVVEFHGQRTNRSDLAAFFDRYVPNTQPSDRDFSCRFGRCEAQGSERTNPEASVALEYLMGTAPGIKTEVWSFSSMSWCTDLKNWTAQVLDREDPPLVFSVNCGAKGNISLDRIQGCSPEIVQNIEDDFVKIASRGITLIFPSGDDGSGGASGAKDKLWPEWPGSVPHATSVGATEFEYRQQRAPVAFGSGGGFSWRSPRPSWQHGAVEGYLWNPFARLPAQQDFNRHGRATPDLAALGTGYEAIAGGRPVVAGGTAAAAPFFASLVSLLNEYRLQRGQSPLGFLNPLIYDMGMSGKGFMDIKKGENRLDRNARHLREGYSCTKGWDAVTGWGAPRFQDMLEYVKSLPSGRRPEEIVV